MSSENRFSGQRCRLYGRPVLFEVRCPGCGLLGWCPCAACVEALESPEPATVDGADSVALLFSHDGVGREFIHALKYRGERAIARWLGESLALAHLAAVRSGRRGELISIASAGAGPAPVGSAALGRASAVPASAGTPPIDAVTWAPTTDAHRRARGFDQAETLARATATALRVRPARLLRRIGSAVQSGAGRAERLAGPRFQGRRLAAGRRVLLVDDVLTTGATLRSAVAVLLDAGAAAVHVAACARRGHSDSASAA